MFDIPEIIDVLRSSGATEEIVEKVSSHFHNRLGDVLDDMAKDFMTSEEYTEFLLEENNNNSSIGAQENNNENITREQSICFTLQEASN
jgi:hypothetical protein